MQQQKNKYRIITWNCQGSAMAKLEASYSSLFRKDAYNILLIQELGQPKHWYINKENDDEQIVYGSSSRGSYVFNYLLHKPRKVENERCSLGILNEEPISQIYCFYPDWLKRPCLFTFIGSGTSIILVATMHATADGGHNASQEEIRKLISVLESGRIELMSGGYMNFHGWILMGDFNNIPKKLIKKIPGNYEIFLPDTMTHEKGKILDYALYSNNVRINKIETVTVNQSDHYPISIEIDSY